MAKKNRIGEIFETSEGYEIKIIEYNNNKDVTIQFQDKYKTILKHKTYQNCKNGNIKNPYHPNEYGGYIGVGKYKSSINGKMTDEYSEWKHMLKRGIDEDYKNEHPTYKEVFIAEYFYNFQNYCKWREFNYYKIEGEQMCLDKDILYKGNKIYSPNTCIFVPQRINNLFVKKDACRGECPIGVSYCKKSNKYRVYCKTLNCHKYLGLYNTKQEAFKVYKEFKEAYINEVADEYKGRIPDRLYEAMYNWKVDIDD